MYFEEKQLKRRQKFEGKIFSVAVDNIVLPDETKSEREVVLHRGAVCIAPLTADNKLVFVRQYRYPMQEVLLELPAGRIEIGEEPAVTARRELEEETGCLTSDCIPLGVSYPTPGYSTEKIYLYAARVDSESVPKPDEGEFVKKELIDIDQALEKVYNGEICDSKTAILILLLDKAIKDGKITV